MDYKENKIYLILENKDNNKQFKKYFENEFEKDKFKRKLKYSKRIKVIFDSNLINYID